MWVSLRAADYSTCKACETPLGPWRPRSSSAIDRQSELSRLTALLGRAGGALALVWGRRRVGKTRLLLE